MINLLPPKIKEELRQETSWKIIMILGINILIIFVCFVLVLYAINIFILGEINSQKIIYQQKEKELKNSQAQELEENLIAFNKTLFQLDDFYQKKFKATEFLEEISKTLPVGIYLVNLSISRKNKEIECILSGFSPNREILLEFKDNLEKKENFKEVYFPSETWISPININFKTNFKINP